MRPIKFRAWDHRAKTMREVREIAFDNHGGVDVWCSCDGINSPALGQNSLMQFTGLLDKNGVEIYEGDILRTPDYTTQVEWDVKMAGWMPLNYFNTNGCNSLEDEFYDLKNCEVIGNIHQAS